MKADARRVKAARSLAQGQSKAAASRAAGVNRSTINRWLEDSEFQDLLLEQKELLSEPDPLEAAAENGLGSLVPQAIAVLEQALNGSGVTAAKARVALDIVKAAATLRGAEETVSGASESLGSILERLDARGARSD